SEQDEDNPGSTVIFEGSIAKGSAAATASYAFSCKGLVIIGVFLGTWVEVLTEDADRGIRRIGPCPSTIVSSLAFACRWHVGKAQGLRSQAAHPPVANPELGRCNRPQPRLRLSWPA